ncbi:MAG: hypothetical protein A3B13_02960 [Candidatus Liptonbacteria bacterium RIFCSPLOWO2_01_FULL_45_15]|uniref:Lycopene cyclase domain-containing protein n=1 Tax=Candidatus Liptonbacteria bacterium RIFCSPLOWO2_01_FULL_45_15 TaxID=1798649 RepID=A0A1G2CFC1_9BACT|nr:MAG: hypothetical protein A3B13_02960 [Candidatus Liptonbacteria bacterium RIFCSPLOWO2_01_FULL_45_15]
MEYLFILSLFLLSAVFLEWKFRIHLYSTRKETIIATLIFFVAGATWDSIGVLRGHWLFPGGAAITNIFIGVLPLEEYLFMLIVPYWIITVYRVVVKTIK